MNWLNDVIKALENLDGEAHIDSIYKEVEKIRSKPLPKSWQGIIRRRLHTNSSSSKSFQGNDLFFSPRIGSGIWALRAQKNVTAETSPKLRKLLRFQKYSRKDVAVIFDPGYEFQKSKGRWGISGIIQIPDRPKDYVLFVTIGTKHENHDFDEEVSPEGVLKWQSQPNMNFKSKFTKDLIAHDPLKNSIYLFLRTAKGEDYEYLGKLQYISHNIEKENPVWFNWQIIDWNLQDSRQANLNADEDNNIEQNKELREPRFLHETPPPKRNVIIKNEALDNKSFKARAKPDYSLRDEKNRKLGLNGEQLVLKYEISLLTDAGRIDLANKVFHTSEIEGDGAGYDILSFSVEGNKKFIEVKTTNGGINTDFFLSANELAFSEKNSSNYSLYRVYDYKEAPKFYQINGALNDHFKLEPTNYLAKVK